MSRRSLIRLAALAVLILLPVVLYAQRGGGFFGGGREPRLLRNLDYDGRFNVVRIRYRSAGRWSADYPTMEQNLSAMLDVLTAMPVHTDGSNVYFLDDPDLLKYPVAYLTEPGFWVPNDAEIQGLKNYVDKGGFLIVDDFHFDNEWNVFERAMRRVLPTARIDQLDASHPVFNSFFTVANLRVPYPGPLGQQGLYGEFMGIHEDNDPSKRLMVVINFNMDIGDYMEWSGTDLYEFASTNEAYKFGINYIVYGLTH